MFTSGQMWAWNVSCKSNKPNSLLLSRKWNLLRHFLPKVYRNYRQPHKVAPFLAWGKKKIIMFSHYTLWCHNYMQVCKIKDVTMQHYVSIRLTEVDITFWQLMLKEIVKVERYSIAYILTLRKIIIFNTFVISQRQTKIIIGNPRSVALLNVHAI